MDSPSPSPRPTKPSLSALRSLWERYLGDPYFREAWFTLEEAFGVEFAARLDRMAMVVFKPDAAVGRKLEDGIAFLQENGFHPTSCSLIWHTRHTVRETWRFQHAAATRQSFALIDACLCAGPSLVVFLEDILPEQHLLGAERLHAIKGGKEPIPGQLRHRLGLSNVFLSFVHSPDDAADLVREIGIYFPDGERLTHLQRHVLGTGCSSELATYVRALYEQYPVHDLSLIASLRRIAHAARQHVHDSVCASIEHFCESLAARSTQDYPKLFSLLDEQGVESDPWDRIVVAAELCEWPTKPPEPTFGTSVEPSLAGRKGR